MNKVSTFANGQTLTSSALTDDEMNDIFQSLACDMLGIALNDPARNSAVRISWDANSAPAWNLTDDIVSIKSTLEDSNSTRARDEWYTEHDSINAIKNIEYTNEWRINFIARGPNAFDRMRIIKDALFLEFTHDTLASNKLYVLPSIQTPLKIPEKFQSRWWPAIHMNIELYEQVDETLVMNSITSAEVILETSKGIVSDIIVGA